MLNRSSELLVQVEYDYDAFELTMSFKFNSFNSENQGNQFNHSKLYKRETKFTSEDNILDTLSNLERNYFGLLEKIFVDTNNMFQSIRMVSPVTNEGIAWDQPKMMKIKIMNEIMKNKE